MSKRSVGLWFYQNGGGKEIENRLKNKLQEREIKSISNIDLNKAIVSDGSIICKPQENCNINILDEIDLYFSYNASEQTTYQTYLYQAINKLIPTINNYDSFILSEDKFQTSFLLKHNGINTAQYELFHQDNHDYLSDVLKKWPSMVYKPINGWGGKGLTKIGSRIDISILTHLLDQMNLTKVYIEKFIDHDNTDFRIDIVDGKFVSCYGRRAAKGEWKTNVSSGGSIFLREANDEVVNLAIKAANITGLEIAGVDIIYDREKEEYIVLEVNGIPAFATPNQEAEGLDFNNKKIDAIVELIDKKTAINT